MSWAGVTALVDSSAPQVALVEGPAQVLPQKALPSFLVVVDTHSNQLLLHLGPGFTVD